MSKERSDFSLLLFVVMLLSASIGLLHGFKFTMLTAATQNEAALSQQDMMDLIYPQLISGDMEKAAATLQQYDVPSQLKLALQIVKGNGISLPDEPKILFLGALAQFAKSKTQREILFAMLLNHFPKKPVLALITKHFPKIARSVIHYFPDDRTIIAKDRKLQLWKYAAIAYTLAQNDAQLLADLYTNGLRLTQKEASIVLDRVVQSDRSPEFVATLVRQFDANTKRADDGKRTPLLKAVMANNKEMVRALLSVGADPNYVADEATGSPLSYAVDKGLYEIQELLRSF